ncbi:MAG: type VI secretion system baseplate subunit TssK [Myxococcales bacterium]|nr:type VI secretion system baseplate subunit TssK [Myxococcales bacterium]
MAERDLTPIAWRDGALIAPQHLQRQDLFHQASLAGRLAALSPYTWGVSRLRLDDAALRQGQARVLEVEAVFADGTLARARADERGAPPPRAIAEALPPSAERLDVALALPEFREGADNFAGDVDARYRPAIRREVADLCGGRSRVDLEVGEANLALLLGDEARRPGVQTIKIGEVVRGADGGLAWSTGYVPPCLAIGAAPGLGAELRAILALAIARRRALVELRREHDPERAEFLGRDVTHYLLLDALGGAIPALRHLVEEPGTPPLAAYLTLAELAGKLTSFATQVDPAALPSFHYLDLRASFDGLFAAIREMLGIAIEAGFVRIPLALRQEDGVWLGRASATTRSPAALRPRGRVLAAGGRRRWRAPRASRRSRRGGGSPPTSSRRPPGCGSSTCRGRRPRSRSGRGSSTSPSTPTIPTGVRCSASGPSRSTSPSPTTRGGCGSSSSGSARGARRREPRGRRRSAPRRRAPRAAGAGGDRGAGDDRSPGRRGRARAGAGRGDGGARGAEAAIRGRFGGDAATASKYALAALADEVALREAGPLREHWRPRSLQLHYFQDNRAGYGFFERLAALEGAASSGPAATSRWRSTSSRSGSASRGATPTRPRGGGAASPPRGREAGARGR